jgi:hypothetical protein
MNYLFTDCMIIITIIAAFNLTIFTAAIAIIGVVNSINSINNNNNRYCIRRTTITRRVVRENRQNRNNRNNNNNHISLGDEKIECTTEHKSTQTSYDQQHQSIQTEPNVQQQKEEETNNMSTETNIEDNESLSTTNEPQQLAAISTDEKFETIAVQKEEQQQQTEQHNEVISDNMMANSCIEKDGYSSGTDFQHVESNQVKEAVIEPTIVDELFEEQGEFYEVSNNRNESVEEQAVLNEVSNNENDSVVHSTASTTEQVQMEKTINIVEVNENCNIEQQVELVAVDSEHNESTMNPIDKSTEPICDKKQQARDNGTQQKKSYVIQVCCKGVIHALRGFTCFSNYGICSPMYNSNLHSTLFHVMFNTSAWKSAVSSLYGSLSNGKRLSFKHSIVSGYKQNLPILRVNPRVLSERDVRNIQVNRIIALQSIVRSTVNSTGDPHFNTC